MKSTLRTVLFAGSLVAVAPAQTTHLVGPSGFAQIRDALAVAAPGDIIDVQPGTYAHFEANIGVTIRAVTTGTALIAYDPTFASACSPSQCGATRIAAPAGQVVHCIGLDFRPNSVGYAHRVVVASGAATFDACSLQSLNVSALDVVDARAHLQSCSLAGVHPGNPVGALRAINAVVTAVRCSFTGSTTASVAGIAVQLSASELHGSQLQLVGGSNPFGSGSAALSLGAGSSAWISDSVITGGSGACPVNSIGGTGRLDRCVLLPTGPCSTFPFPMGGTLPSGLVVGADSTTPVQNGGPFTVDWRTSPNQLLAVYASPGLGHLPLPGLTDQPATIDFGSAWSRRCWCRMPPASRRSRGTCRRASSSTPRSS